MSATVTDTLLAQLPMLLVVAPLIAAALCLLVRDARLVWWLAMAVSAAALVFSVTLFVRTGGGLVLEYAVGGWQPPWGIAYKVAPVNALMALVLSAVFLAGVVYAGRSFGRELRGRRLQPVYSALLICQSGFFGVAMTDDLFNIFVFLEMASIAGYALVASARTPRALTAAFRYLLMGTTGAALFLLGIGYLYLVTGTLNLSDMAPRLQPSLGSPAVVAALGFIGAGLLLKAALFPLHLWLPNAYAHAPSAIAAVLSGTGTKVALYILIRLLFGVFDAASFSAALPDVMMVLAPAAIVAGSGLAIFQRQVKRMMAYSSVAQIGYIVLGVALVTQTGLAAGLVHLFNHAIIKVSLFMALGCVVYRAGACRLSDLAGLSSRMPWTAAAIVAGAVSLVGLPLTSGFVSKWYLVSAVLEANLWLPAFVILAGSLMSAAYGWRLVEAAYFRGAEGGAGGEGAAGGEGGWAGKDGVGSASGVGEGNEDRRAAEDDNGGDGKTAEAPPVMLLTTWALIALNFFVGVNPSWLTRACLGIAGTLLG